VRHESYASALLIVFLATTGQAPSGLASVTGGLSDDDRQVVAAALDWMKPGKSALLLDSTAPMCGAEMRALCIRQEVLDRIPPAAWIPTDHIALRTAFVARNRYPISLGRMAVDFRVVDAMQVRTMFAKGRWRDVGEKFPGVRHLVYVSAPAYTAEGSRALVYVESLCSGRCGGGGVLLLRREIGGWLLERGLITWIG
jgi:hypothetical protein